MGDPIVTIIFTIIVICTTWSISIGCINVLMEATPIGLDLDNLRKKLEEIEGVIKVQDLHAWALGAYSKKLMEANLIVENNMHCSVLYNATCIARDFKIYHSTIQVQE